MMKVSFQELDTNRPNVSFFFFSSRFSAGSLIYLFGSKIIFVPKENRQSDNENLNIEFSSSRGY